MRQLLALKWRLLPLVVAVAVLCIPIIEGALNRHQISVAVQTAQSELNKHPKAAKIEGTPRRIIIPNLSIDLPVVSQSYSRITKTWPVSPASANYAVESSLINNSHGQSLIYGHNNRAVFGSLLKIKPDTIVYVYTDNGHIFKYSYIGSQDVSPRQTDIVANMTKEPAGLNLITCDGAYFQYRHLMSFKLTKAV